MIINLLIICETFGLIFTRNLDRDTFSLVGLYQFEDNCQLGLLDQTIIRILVTPSCSCGGAEDLREQQVVGRRELAAAGGAERRN